MYEICLHCHSLGFSSFIMNFGQCVQGISPQQIRVSGCTVECTIYVHRYNKPHFNYVLSIKVELYENTFVRLYS